jgi:hypothetical protein
MLFFAVGTTTKNEVAECLNKISKNEINLAL